MKKCKVCKKYLYKTKTYCSKKCRLKDLKSVRPKKGYVWKKVTILENLIKRLEKKIGGTNVN